MTNYKSKPIPPVFKDMKTRESAYKDLFLNTNLGRDVLKDLLQETAVTRTAFNRETNQAFMNMGKQTIGYHLINLLNIQLQEVNEL